MTPQFSEPVESTDRAINYRAAVHSPVDSHRTGSHLHLPQSTVSQITARYRMTLLGHVDLNTGLTIRRLRPVRYEHAKRDQRSWSVT